MENPNIAKLKVDYEALFSSDVGQRVLEDILLSCGVKKSYFSNDALEMARSAGRQEVGLHIEFMATPIPEKKIEIAEK